MKTVVNKTRRPIKLALGGGKVLHLGPGNTGQVADAATERSSFRKLVDAGDIEVSGEGDSEGARAGDTGRAGHESTHGHAQPNLVHPSGNR